MESNEGQTEPELPEARPLPNEANPGGTEGVDPGWPRGSSEVLGPEPEGDTTYSTKDVGAAGRVDKVGPFACALCERVFERPSELEAHMKTEHPTAASR